MLELNHVTLKNGNRTLLKDLTLRFSDCGCMSIQVDDTLCAFMLARVLGGITYAQTGEIRYDGRVLGHHSEQALAAFRQSYTMTLFGDFQLQLEKTIQENVCMGLQVQQDFLEMVLNKWRLHQIRDNKIEDLDFITQAKTALARIELRSPSMLVFLPDSTSYSKHELEQLYTLFTILSKNVLIVVIQDPAFERFANRKIAFNEGYLISDNEIMEEDDALIMQNPVAFHVPKSCFKKIMNHIYRHYRWAYRALAVLFVFAILFVSFFIFTYQIDIVDMKMRTLEKAGTASFSIQKLARDNNDLVYSSLYEPFALEDKAALEGLLNDHVAAAAFPIDMLWANSYLEGHTQESQYTRANYAAVVELQEEQVPKTVSLQGHWPSTYEEVALTLSDARIILKGSWDETYEDYIGETFNWYGRPLTITGILEESLLQNVDMKTIWGDALNIRIFVQEGFLEYHPISQLSSFPISHKRLLHNNRMYSFPNIYPISQIKNYFHDPYENQLLGDNDIILNYDMAIILGFQPDPDAGYYAMLEDYQVFAKQWINTEIQVQAYTIEASPANSIIFHKPMRIAGFTYPLVYDYFNTAIFNKGSIYISDIYMDAFLVPNIGYENMYFLSDDNERTKQALYTLEDNSTYEAVLPGNMSLQYLMRDLKALDEFLLVAAAACLGVSLFLYLLLIYKTKERAKQEMSVFYTFGETPHSIIMMYMRNSTRILLRDLIIATFSCTLLLLLLMVGTIWKLYVSSQLFWILMIPFFVSLFILVFLQTISYMMLRIQPLVVDDYDHSYTIER